MWPIVTSNPIRIRSPGREEWTDNFNTPNDSLNISTDGSKLGGRVGGGVFSENHPWNYRSGYLIIAVFFKRRYLQSWRL